MSSSPAVCRVPRSLAFREVNDDQQRGTKYPINRKLLSHLPEIFAPSHTFSLGKDVYSLVWGNILELEDRTVTRSPLI